MPTVEANGRSIHFLTGVNGVAPERRTVVFIHGAGGNALVWQNQRRALDRGVNTVCLDLPGHGQSPGPACTSIAEYSDCILRFIQTLELRKVVLSGHSMGGGVALEAAIEYPEELAGLILVGSGARLKVSSKLTQGLLDDFEATTSRLVQSCYGPESSGKLVRWALEQLLDEKREVLLQDFRACNDFDRMDDIQRIRLPVLVLCGSEDVMTPPKYSNYLADNLRQSTLRIIERAGHMVMLENPFHVNAAILKFLADLK